MFLKPAHLGTEHILAGFDCGVESLNLWLIRNALQADRGGSARTFVVQNSETGTVAGYFSLTVGQVDISEAPERFSRGLGRYPIPVVLLARLAVDLRFQGQGLGGAMLHDAVRRTFTLAENVGIRAMLVHPANEAAEAFYMQYGFVGSPIREQQLMLLLKDAKKTFRL